MKEIAGESTDGFYSLATIDLFCHAIFVLYEIVVFILSLLCSTLKVHLLHLTQIRTQNALDENKLNKHCIVLLAIQVCPT